MFGRNEIVGTKYFTTMAPDTLLVTSVFHTLQGEGPFSGKAAVFIRLAKCNLQCWFCDTYFDKGDVYTTDQLLGLANGCYPRSASSPPPMLVITGGEPMLQSNLTQFLARAIDKFPLVQIESNGLLLKTIPSTVHLLISPKCAEKNGRPTHHLQPPNRVLLRANSMKFVLAADPDSPYHSIPDWAFDWAGATGNPLYASPMAEYLPEVVWLQGGVKDTTLKQRTNAEKVSFWTKDLLNLDKVRRNHEHTARYCLRNGVTMTMQMQLFSSLP